MAEAGLTLYWDKGGANMAPHAALELIGQPHRLVQMDLAKGDQHRPDYLRLNPNARVPTLLDGGTAIYEAAAILLHLADRHPEVGLAPACGSIERGRFYQWLMYLTNTLQESANRFSHPELATADPAGYEAARTCAAGAMARQWQVIDDAIAGPYMLGDKLGALDLYIHMIAFWSRRYSVQALSYPKVGALVRKVHDQPAVRRMMDIEGIEWVP